MWLIFKILLTVHIIGGAVGLTFGTINLIAKKGTRIHKLFGKIFSFCMIATGLSALLLSIIHPNYFLFMVGILTIYLVGSGHRYIYLKMLGKNPRVGLIDWTLSGAMLVAGIVFFVIGTRLLWSNNLFGCVFIVFGVIGLLFVKRDYANYRGKVLNNNYWILAHLQRMTGGYIAALTAFLVVNHHYFPKEIPGFVMWLLPTAVLTPMIIYWSRQYDTPLKSENHKES